MTLQCLFYLPPASQDIASLLQKPVSVAEWMSFPSSRDGGGLRQIQSQSPPTPNRLEGNPFFWFQVSAPPSDCWGAGDAGGGRGQDQLVASLGPVAWAARVSIPFWLQPWGRVPQLGSHLNILSRYYEIHLGLIFTHTNETLLCSSRELSKKAFGEQSGLGA